MRRDLVQAFAVVTALVAGVHGYKVLARTFAGTSTFAEFCTRVLDDDVLAVLLLHGAILVASLIVLVTFLTSLAWRLLTKATRLFATARSALSPSPAASAPKRNGAARPGGKDSPALSQAASSTENDGRSKFSNDTRRDASTV